MLLFPPLHRDASLFQPAQIIAFGKILPIHGQVGVVVGVVQNVRLAVHGIQPLLLGGKAPGLHRVFFVAAAALALVMGQPGVGCPRNAVPRIPHPQAEIHIVEGHRKGFVQPLYLVPHAGLYQQAGTSNGRKVLHRGGAEQKIRKYLIDNNYIECIIQLPDNLFYGTSIATCIMVLKKSKVDNQTLFIDASKEFVKSTNSNKLGDGTSSDEPNNIQNILNAYINRKTEKHFTALVKQEDIENADYNLSVSTYVESEDTREVIDIDVLNKQISEIVQRENTLRAEIDAIIAEIEEA